MSSRFYRKHFGLFAAVALAGFTSQAVNAEIQLPKILASHMVVQRDLPVHVWGWAAAGETISVAFRGETSNFSRRRTGSGSVYLQPGKAGGPFNMTLKDGAQTVALDDVLVGDVWVAGRPVKHGVRDAPGG